MAEGHGGHLLAEFGGGQGREEKRKRKWGALG